ncbi:MAG: hydrogenase expression/formation protein HypE [Candidatus Tectimicrobiota bacterium]
MDAALSSALGSCPVPLRNFTEVTLAHGSGGQLTADLIEHLFLPAFHNPHLAKLNDQAVLECAGARLAFSTDAFVVTPLFFPGGDIGQLAVNGTVNDLAMSGARPLFLSAAFILEEGLPLTDLTRLVHSMQTACAAAGVTLVTGDTKVVNRGSGDQVFITTSGIGLIEHNLVISAEQARVGDAIILSGTIADHGMAVMSTREGLAFETAIRSDTTPLSSLVQAMLEASPAIHCLRDPTRGGVATSLHEIARRAQLGLVIEERTLPIREEVKGACEILGLDPLYVANEGKLIALVDQAEAPRVLRRMHSHPDGKAAQIIGKAVAEHPGMVVMRTAIGGSRIVSPLLGEQLPRIC